MAVIRETTIPKAPLARLMLKAGAQRVSQDAVNAMEELLAAKAKHICAQAITIAKHSGRKTVTGGDVRIAAKQ
ncbi:MAG TPA: histone [Candidatus Binatia bacterium]|nr:histone [Candidatus Binatia bacterium]